MEKNYPYFISLLVMFVLLPFTFPEWVYSVLGLHMIANFVWTVILLFKK